MSKRLIVCIAVFSNLLLLLVADPILSCAPEEDPYDYYTSFFQHQMESQPGMRPFYYTSLRFLYDDQDELPVDRATSAEWATYLAPGVSDSDAYDFVCAFNDTALTQVYAAMTSTPHDVLNDTITANSMARKLLLSHNIAAMRYLIFARSIAPYVEHQRWWYEPVEHDSARMVQAARRAEQLLATETDAFLQQRYAYQALRLCYYSNSYRRANAVYAKYFKSENTARVLDRLALSIKAGILFHANKKAEAAYLYSKMFGENPTAKISNYLSFGWCLDSAISESKYYSYCKNTREAANMVALFALHNPGNAFDDMRKVAALDPHCEALEVLLTREIHKIEEAYLSPRLNRMKGAMQLFITFPEEQPQETSNAEAEASDLIGFCERMSADRRTSNPALFQLGAAYLSFVIGKLQESDRLCGITATMELTASERDQLQLTRLLVAINQQKQLDDAFEAKLLPSLRWMEAKARRSHEWAKFYRNILSSVIGPRYLAEGKTYKMVLTLGRSERLPTVTADGTDSSTEEYDPANYAAISYPRESLTSSELQALYSFLSETKHSAFEEYLINGSAIDSNDVIDGIGTGYLRTHNWTKAAEWFRKVPPAYFQRSVYKFYLNANSFADLINDTHAPTEQDTVSYTKLSFAERMAQLENNLREETNPQLKADAYYAIASGLYQMSYYGNSWMLSDYSWQSASSPLLDSLANGDWQREYYGAFTAEQYFAKAAELAQDRNMKARALFLAAKCNQKQQIGTFGHDGFYGTLSEMAKGPEQEAMRQFLFNSRYFPTLASEYSNTQFFQEALNTCSYLNDYYTKVLHK